MTVTDPPVKLLRRLIPQLTIGAVRFDLSIMVLLLVAFIGMQLAFNAMRPRPEAARKRSATYPIGERISIRHAVRGRGKFEIRS